MNPKLEAALAYGRMRWRIFPCHSIVQADVGPACSCGKASCGSPGKHPRTRAGFKEATDDADQIRRWWTRWPDANIALATGSGLAVIDIDGQLGAAEFKALIAEHGPVPETLTASTGRGLHLVFATREGPEVRSSARGNVHVRGEGGYIIVAPSQHVSGKTYTWIRRHKVALLPDWLRQWSQGYDIANKTVEQSSLDHLGPLPGYLSGSTSKTNEISEPLKAEYSPSEEMRIKSALSSIPADGYETWFQCGMALKALDWQRSDGTEIGFDLWLEWSQTCSEKFSYQACIDKWQSFKRSGVTIGTVFHLAQQHGWNGGVPAPLGSPLGAPVPPGGMNGTHNPLALPAAFNGPQAIFFPDKTADGAVRATCTNAGVAIAALGISCQKDLFHEKMLVGGHPIHEWAGEMSDDVIQMIRKVIRFKFGFDPNDKNTRDACTQLCLEHQFDPVADYLAGLQWDGKPRLEAWLSTYMGAAPGELNAAIGRLVLIAAVRRVRRPGTKFDQIVVLEGLEGRGKSTAIEILAGRDNFSDQKILGLSDKEQQEAMCGIWLYEIADLTGMRRAETEHVKAFASRTVDRARPAYGRYRLDRPRRTICFATTNDDEYLRSETGNRRFWPVVTGWIDLEALRRDRDQLWAEAALREGRGDSIGLPERLWKQASEEQVMRLESDEWAGAIHAFLNLKDKERHDVSVMEVLAGNQFLQIEAARVGRSEKMRAGAVLRRMGFLKYRKRLAGNALEWRYRRPG